MNRIKVEKVVDVFCDNLNIANIRYRNIIKELMVNIIQKYETCGIKEIEDNQQYLIKSNNSKYSVEDFFLNRLLFNVTSFEVKDTGGRADYSDYQRKISLNRNKLATLLDRYSNMSFTDEQKFLAAKKVIMHEFEHALQTSFEQGPYINDFEHYKSLYNRLLSANLNIQLNEIYDGRKLLQYMGNGRRIQSGLMGSNDSDLYKKYTGTFYLNPNHNRYTTENNVNEIFNESEALVMSGSDEKKQEIFPSGNQINVRNVESSNFLITNYGFMLKKLLGEQKTFQGMYLDRNVIIDYFNTNYGKIFEQVFGDHFRKKYPNINIFDGWSILHMAINEAKYSYEDGAKEFSEICHVKLNLALSLCFEKMIKEKIILGESFDSIKQQWNEFANLSLYNSDIQKNNTLPHAQILNNLREYIKQQGINNNVNQSNQGHSR